MRRQIDAPPMVADGGIACGIHADVVPLDDRAAHERRYALEGVARDDIPSREIPASDEDVGPEGKPNTVAVSLADAARRVDADEVPFDHVVGAAHDVDSSRDEAVDHQTADGTVSAL